MTSDLELLRRWKSRLGSQLIPPKVTFCPIEKKMVEVAKNCSTCIFAKVGTDDFPYCEYEYMERI